MLMTLKAALFSEMTIMKLTLWFKSLFKAERTEISTHDREVLCELEAENKPFIYGK